MRRGLGRREVVWGSLSLAAVGTAGATQMLVARRRAGRSSEGGGGGAGPATLRAVVVPARRAPRQRSLYFQGEAVPFASVTLYAKVSGYLRQIHVDRGDRVVAQQKLAEVQSPEIDRQSQAAVADAAYKRANARSAAALTGRGAIPRREVQAARSSADMADAVLAGLRSQKEATVLRAPFDGTVTARFADPGDLVQNATSAQNGALPLVTVSQTERLRVYVYVDQRNARSVQVGDPAEVMVPESGLSIAGRVERANGELDARTRTMLVEIVLDNRQGLIFPGSFVRVRLTVKNGAAVEVPAEALLLRGQKPFVAVVGPDNRVELRAVSLAELEGSSVGIVAGLAEGERVALHLGRAVLAGDVIEPVAAGPR
jgi:membrane fusion protein, multidrug efflux system